MKSAIKKVLKEELNDYYGLVGHTWHIDFKNEEESIEGQKWLFKNGFRWPERDYNIIKGRRSVQSIWQDNVDARTFTGSDSWPYSESLRVTKQKGLEKPIHIIWSDFRNILDLDFDATSRLFDSLNESEEDEIENHDYDFLREINLVGMEFRYDRDIYRILKDVDEDGNLLLTNPYYGAESAHSSVLKYELETLIDALNRGDHAELLLDDVNLDKLYESEEDDLEWAQDIVSNTPNIYINPFPPKASNDDTIRIIRSRNRDTTEKTINDLVDLLFSLGYHFRGVYEERTISRYLNSGGYLFMYNSKMAYGNNESLFKSLNGKIYSEVPNYFI